jgi:ATP-dependent Clp protease ATP-binding subunit ClpC
MYDRFTDRARKVMRLAHREAQRFDRFCAAGADKHLGTEHILLGLVKEGGGVAANVLASLGIDLRMVRLEVEKLVPAGPGMVTMGKPPHTPRAKKIIEYAIEEARNLNHNDVGTEHLLLGLLREQEGVAAQVLLYLGAETTRVRSAVMALLRAEVPDDIDERADAEFEALPADVRQAMEELNREIGRLEWAKEEAIAAQQFERAAALRAEIRKLGEQKRAAVSHRPVDERIRPPRFGVRRPDPPQ